MSKKNKEPLQLEATLDLTDEGDHAMIDIVSVDGRELSPQVILDAVADMLQARFSMSSEEWDIPSDGLDS